jgi:hypothetical protein
MTKRYHVQRFTLRAIVGLAVPPIVFAYFLFIGLYYLRPVSADPHNIVRVGSPNGLWGLYS